MRCLIDDASYSANFVLCCTVIVILVCVNFDDVDDDKDKDKNKDEKDAMCYRED